MSVCADVFHVDRFYYNRHSLTIEAFVLKTSKHTTLAIEYVELNETTTSQLDSMHTLCFASTQKVYSNRVEKYNFCFCCTYAQAHIYSIFHLYTNHILYEYIFLFDKYKNNSKQRKKKYFGLG